MSRKQIGTVRITRVRNYPLDPYTSSDRGYVPEDVLVEPGEYPVYEDGLSRYWRMTGFLNRGAYRMGDGMFGFSEGDADVRSDDDVVFYSRRYGPDDWKKLMSEFKIGRNPALVFTTTEELIS